MSSSPGLNAVALRIIARDALPRENPEALAAALSLIFSRIEEVTASMVGQVGYDALLQRARKRARARYAWLPERSELERGFPYQGWEPLIAAQGVEASIDAAHLLLAYVLDLVASFLGEDFVYRLVRRAWPDSGSNPTSPSEERSESEEA